MAHNASGLLLHPSSALHSSYQTIYLHKHDLLEPAPQLQTYTQLHHLNPRKSTIATMRFSWGNKLHRQAHVQMVSKLSETSTINALASDVLLDHITEHGDSFPVSQEIRINNESVASQLLPMGKLLPELAIINQTPYSLEQIQALELCAQTLITIFEHLSETKSDYDGDRLLRNLPDVLHRYLVSNGLETTYLFVRDFTTAPAQSEAFLKPERAMVVMIDYALFICSNLKRNDTPREYGFAPIPEVAKAPASEATRVQRFAGFLKDALSP
ncbi:hypothetical protein Slin14017_G109060 [Septoria linicola]|nr:hypothetical protein Slin14017_G109060 [Septoria linicola]